jgi:uncharacterized protein YndB with AHSA1/START domain
VDAAGYRVVQLSIVLNAPAKAAFDAFTDPETMKRWVVKMAVADLRHGGTIEDSYLADAKPGDPENIRQEIIAYVPGQLMVFRNTNAPRMLPDREAFKKVVTILQVRDLGGGRSELTLSQSGYAPAPEFDRLHAFFKDGNAGQMQQMKHELESPQGKLYVAAR